MKRYPLRAALAALLLMGLLFGCGGAAEETPEATEAATEVAELAPTEAAAQPTATTAAPAATPTTAATLPPPPQPTAVPTDAPTETPVATDTPTATPVPPTPIPPTPRPVQPTAIPPTAIPPTAVPPTAPPTGANGLTATFGLQSRADLSVNGKIWFEFTINNATGGDVPYNALGVMPRKDGADRTDWYQHSYGGPNSTIDADGMTWEDHIEIPEAGDYTLRLVMCFDGYDRCRAHQGTWVSMSPEIPITVR